MSPEYRNLEEPQQQFQSLNAAPEVAPAPVEKPAQKQAPAPIERPQVQPRGPLDSRSIAKPNETFSISRQGIVPSGESQSLAASANANQNFIVPTDGREQDPLQRWQGAPIICFGFGGTVVTSFLQRIPRFATNQRMPMVKCIPGEIKVSGSKVLPVPESLATFPGPLKSKGKKKEVLEWLEKSVQRLSQGQPDLTQPVAGTTKRDEERVLLWRTLKALVEHDGNIDGNKAAESEMRKIFSPETDAQTPWDTQRSTSPSAAHLDGLQNPSAPASPAAINDLRKHLLQGDREKAVWLAVDQKLWGHAMLIASTLPPNIWKQVAQEFVRNDVKKAGGDNTESLAALYDVFAGNWEESVDELVPPSARAGLQMMSKSLPGAQTRNALDGLDRWRETLSLILSNRTTEDARALIALGQLLLQYGRPEAAHLCFVFSKAAHLFGGPEDAQASVVLLGANHRQDPFGYSNDVDSILLTEVYEYVYAVLSPLAVSTLTPHLQAYKLYHAELASEYGLREQAQQYCDAISSTLKATTKMSPYYHPRLVTTLEELNLRLRQSPKDSTGSWISKPSIDKVSSSVWNRFTHFVAGEDSDRTSNASGQPGVDGPFAKINGETPPSISRSGSPSQNFGAYGGGGVYAQPAMSGSTTNLRYAPQASQATPSRPSLDQGSPESVPSSPPNTVRRNPYAPQNGARPRPSTYSPERERYHPTPPVSTVPEQGPPAAQSDPYLPRTQSSAAINHQPGFQGRPGFHEQLARRDSDSSDVPASQVRPPSPLAPPPQTSNTLSPHTDRNSPNYQPRTALYEPRSASYEPRSSSYAPRSALYTPRSYEPSPNSDSGARRPDGRSPYEPQAAEYPFPAAREPGAAPAEPLSQAPASRPLPQDYAPATASLQPPASALGLVPVESEAAAGDLAQTTNDFDSFAPRQQAPSGYEPLPPSDTQASTYAPPSSYEPPSSGYEPPSSGYEPPTSGYEPPSFNYEPPSYDPENTSTQKPSSPPRRRQMMDVDDDDGLGARAAALQSGRATSDTGANNAAPGDTQASRAAEADAQRDAARAAGGGGRSWLGGWSLFNRGGAPDGSGGSSSQPKAVRAKLGEQNQMYYDKEQRRWINPNAADQGPAASRPPPPPMGPAPSRPLSAGPPAAGAGGGGAGGMLSAGQPPSGPPSAGSGPPSAAASRTASPYVGGAPPAVPGPTSAPTGATGSPALSGMPALAPPGGVGSRPGTAMSNASDIDDLLGAPAAKKGGTVKKGKKRGGYVDVMAK